MRQRGFALIAMLGLLLLTSSLALGVGFRTRARLTRADTLAAGVRAEAAARLAVLAAIDSASMSMRATPSSVVGQGHRWHTVDTIGDVIVITGVADLAAKLHINTATDDELRRFLTNSGIGFREADAAAQSVADWRDPDQEHRPRGAEADWYRSAGFDYAPSDLPIVTYAELASVRGVTAEILDVLEAHGSLDGNGQTNLNSAPISLLASLPGMSASAAVAIVARRAERPLTNLAEVVAVIPEPWRRSFEDALPELAPRLTFATGDIEIRTRAMVGRTVFRMVAIAHHTGDGRFVITRARYPDWPR